MPERLHFTDSDEANALIASDPLALLVGFALDQQVTVQKAFVGPLALRERLGALDAATLAAADLEPVFRTPPAIHRYPGSMAKRVHELAGGLDPEALGEHAAQRLYLHLTEAGQRGQVGAQLGRAPRLRPDPRGVAVVAVAQVDRELMHPPRHRAGVAVERGPPAEHRLEVGRGKRGGVDRAEPLAQHERALERLLHAHLLVEREPNEQRHRIGGDQRIGLVRVGEVEPVGHRFRS